MKENLSEKIFIYLYLTPGPLRARLRNRAPNINGRLLGVKSQRNERDCRKCYEIPVELLTKRNIPFFHVVFKHSYFNF